MVKFNDRATGKVSFASKQEHMRIDRLRRQAAQIADFDRKMADFQAVSGPDHASYDIAALNEVVRSASSVRRDRKGRL